jgi:predicted O-methyltransferase YrrM
MGARLTPRRALLAFARSAAGRRALTAIAVNDPRLLIDSTAAVLRRETPFAGSAPESVLGFEDVAFLFRSSQLNRGIASLDFDEAAYLWRLARTVGPTTIVELGRYRGGSTFLLAAAMAPAARLVSYDLHVKGGSGSDDDAELVRALERSGLAGRVDLIVGDSRTAPQPEGPCGLVLVDADHSYDGVRADYLRWRPKLPRGGHLVFHDARALRDLTSLDVEVARFVAELARDDALLFEDLGGVASLAHFRRTDVPLS